MSTPNTEGQVVLTLRNVRLSYFYGFKPMLGTNDSGKETTNYCTHGILTPDHPDLATIKAAMRQVAQKAWPNNWEAVLQQLAAQDRLCLHNGSISKAGQQGYEGNYYVSANSKTRPMHVETRGGQNVVLTESDGRPYSGCYANLMIAIYAQGGDGKPSKFGKRINAQFMGTQFKAHGEAFGGGRVAKPDEFGIDPAEADGAAPTGSPAATANNDLF
jgi:hypothetical protein